MINLSEIKITPRDEQVLKLLVRCPGDFVSTDSPPRIGIGPAEWSRGLGVGANVFPQFPR